jgi:hypothetical protein
MLAHSASSRLYLVNDVLETRLHRKPAGDLRALLTIA